MRNDEGCSALAFCYHASARAHLICTIPCRYFHAVLVRNTGRRVPTTAGGDQLPPRSNTVDTATASPSATQTHGPAPTYKGRGSAAAPSKVNGAAAAAQSSMRATESAESMRAGAPERPERQRGALDKLAKSEGHATSSVDATPPLRGARTLRERSDDNTSRTGSNVHQHASQSRTPVEGNVLRDADSLQNLHHSTHGRSAASGAANTTSTIDSMLMQGGQVRDSLPSKEAPETVAEEDLAHAQAHAQAIANLGLPGEQGRRHAEVRVFDIHTDGPPRGIPEDWEQGLLEGRRRPETSSQAPASSSRSSAPAAATAPIASSRMAEPSTAAPAGKDSHKEVQKEAVDGHGDGAGKGAVNVRLQAAQHAAEQSVEQAKKRAARAKLVRSCHMQQ